MTKIIAIDPGTEASGVVILRQDTLRTPPTILEAFREATLSELRALIMTWCPDHVVCEWLTSYGAAIGGNVLNTARVVGMIEEFARANEIKTSLITVPEVSLELCQTRREKRCQISEAIRSIYRDAEGVKLGNGKDPVRGTKKNPGPLYGVALSAHEGCALAVGLAWFRRNGVRW